MKIEFLRARSEQRGLSLHDRLVGYLPRYAPYAAKVPWLLNLRDRLPGGAKLSEAIAGFSARRSLPKWRSDFFKEPGSSWPGIAVRRTASLRSPMSRPSTSLAQKDVDARHEAGHDGKDVVLFADTFNRYFERENIDAARAVLEAAKYRVHFARPTDGGRPLCCGRTFLSIGKTEEAREEAERTLAALAPFVVQGMPVLGLEPSCLFGFRDEIPALLKSDAAQKVGASALLFEEFLAREANAGKLQLPLAPIKMQAFLHGHCHQKSFDAMGAVEAALQLVPDLVVEKIESSCCGMAGSFGYQADTIDVSYAMGELSLLPAVRKAPENALIVADGTSCRQQIRDGAGREALHVARVLAMALPES
jgi:Fe-S oxidoreductase